ncbi:MAG: VOC family protein [Pseudomonadota bacterium]
MSDAAPTPTKFAHLVLNARKFDETLAFYRELLDARIVHETPMIVFLSYDDEHHRLAIARRPGLLPKLRNMAGVDHHAYTYGSLEDLLGVWQRMRAAGHSPVWCTHHGGTISIYYKDPDGNVVETQVDVFESIEETNEFLAGDDFQSNPIGVDFNPEELLARLKSGEPWETLRLRKPSGPRDPATIPRGYMGWFNWLMIRVLRALPGGPPKASRAS